MPNRQKSNPCNCIVSSRIYKDAKHSTTSRSSRRRFHRIARFPLVIGSIYCTHIRIISPGGASAEYFRNRKGYFSLNVQVVGDADLRIRDIVARWPGATHDQTIFNNISIKARFEANEFENAVLLGDSGYALKKYLITPIPNPTIRSRNPIERLFGVLKRRFPVLSLGVRLSVQTAKEVIIGCAQCRDR
nr:unnamed protein product [Callosobruchus chinensis]